jgi:peptidoglycan/xylan/chitin deacetylase (PgdA/CDA1 family)
MKEHAFWIYLRLTQIRRSRLHQQLSEQGNVPIAILFYHRVADTYPNDWTLSRDDFTRQLDWLQANFDIVTLAEAQRRIRSRFCDRPTIAITFDDGYSDNADYAIPELARRNLPATYFVSTEFVQTGKPFPHDQAAGQNLAPNTIDELRSFLELGIEIGAHSKTHCDLGQLLDEQQIRDEIEGSALQLERWLNTDVRYFAFPYGLPHNTSQRAVNVIAETDLDGFCTAYGAWNWPLSPGFHLRRIHADSGLARLKNWLTLDARKLVDSVTLPFVESGATTKFETQTV